MNLFSEYLLMLPTKSSQFHQKFLMTGTYLLLLKWNHYLQMCRFREINIILDRVYKNKLIATQLKKRTLKKLIKKFALKLSSMIDFSNTLMVLIWVAPLVHFLQTLL